MKKLFLILICVCLCFCGCSKNNSTVPTAEKQASATTNDVNLAVTKEIESQEGFEKFNDETIKALSIVVRTNLLNSKNTEIQNDEYSPKSKHIYELVKQTNGLVLKSENDDEILNHIYIETNEVEQEWVKDIKKVEILKFLTQNNISLSSLSNIKPERDENGRTTSLNLNGKIIPFEDVMNEFEIPSNNIEKIENKKTSIKIHGKGVGTGENFDVFEAEKLAKEGFGYEKILKNGKNNFQIITRK